MTDLRTLAIFDLDNTLLAGDCELIWCSLIASRGLVDTKYIEEISQFFLEYESGSINYVEYDKILLRPLIGLSKNQLDDLVKIFLGQIQHLFRPEILRQLEHHRQVGETILLVTASISLLAAPIAQLLGIPNLICTQIEINNGLPTGNLVGKPVFHEEKVWRVKSWIEQNSVTLEGSWAWGDSNNDIPILSLVDHPVAVYPDDLLRKHAVRNHWQIIENN
ncbi:MAG: HAD-IB family hydrolase [Chloroflexi bacterium HGW-Chloroflexi-8]|jgi:HAD superfamily hydrolase (TIGR01490 family)|nr:MAG: HAD-IB family hydrolase [Chloroflexi bacterium HGW-Chloroflexi-8]